MMTATLGKESDGGTPTPTQTETGGNGELPG